jgi:hypothetical protein
VRTGSDAYYQSKIRPARYVTENTAASKTT